MKLKQLLFSFFFILVSLVTALAQPTTCPAPTPGTPNCFQTSRPAGGNPLTNWHPIPNQDCCNAIPLCKPLNIIENGVVIPIGAPTGVVYPGCVAKELPNSTCFANNEKGTTWYKFQIRPLPGGPTAPGSPAGKLRFKIIPKDVLGLPNYNPFTDNGSTGYGNTDYDFLLFKIPNTTADDGAACTLIKGSSAWNTPNSVIANCNWTGTRGPTGLFEPGTGVSAAQGNRFNKPLNVKVGELYYLAIDNFSVNQQGFQVDFRGLEAPDDFTAIVNPPLSDTIRIKEIVNPKCNSQQFTIKFDKPVRCDSVKGSKFTVLGPNAPYTITTMAPQGGCNSGGQNSAFVFTINPFVPGTIMNIIVTDDIRDLCGNKVIVDTGRMQIETTGPFTFKISGKSPSCGITELTVEFEKEVFCDSVKANKFKILNQGTAFGQVTKVRRANGLSCTPTSLDTLFILSFNKAIKDSVNFQLALVGIIRDFCGNPVQPDSLYFRINPFLSLKADPLVVCPKKTTTLTALLGSTFNGYSVDSLAFRWTNLKNNATLVEDDDSTSFAPGGGIVKIKRDLIYPEVVKYQVIVRNKINGCVDTATVPVRFSARPDLKEPPTLTYCYGEDFTFKPVFTNAKSNELKFAWFRKPVTNDTLSKDSMFTQSVVDSIIAKGLEQIYVLQTRFIDTLGGCVANPTEVKIRYGRKIEPVIDLAPEFRNASITPAEFVFGNQSIFTPLKEGARFDWDFGQGSKATINGTGNATTTYTEGKTGGSPYIVSLTAYDTLYATAVQIGKICQNTDTIAVFVQNLIPSLVTANGDGQNDNFYVKGMRPNSFSLKLYNRWGKLVAEQDPFEIDGWNPKDIGAGTYYYILTEKRSGKTLVSWLILNKE
jgi:gliding motility-associated-like protein